MFFFAERSIGKRLHFLGVDRSAGGWERQPCFRNDAPIWSARPLGLSQVVACYRAAVGARSQGAVLTSPGDIEC